MSRHFGGTLLISCDVRCSDETRWFTSNPTSNVPLEHFIPLFFSHQPQRTCLHAPACLCLINLLSTQPKDAVVGETLRPAAAEPAVQEEQEESCVRMKSPDGCFGFGTEEEKAFLSAGCVMDYMLQFLIFVIYYMDI